jgi:two-component sensor histidine kinase
MKITVRIVVPIIFFAMAISARGQDISRQEADSLLRSLSMTGADTTHINSLLKLALFEIHKPGEFKIDLDSAAEFINQAKQINTKLGSVEMYGYITLIESHFEREKGQHEQAKASVEKAIQILLTGSNKLQLGSAYMELSDYYDYQDREQLPRKIQLVEQAVNNFQLSGDIERTAFSLRMLGEYYVHAADFGKSDKYDEVLDTALQKLNLSLALYQSIHYLKLQGVYVMLGEVYSYLANYGQALNNKLMALKAAENVHDTSMQLCQINNQIGITFGQLGEYEKSVEYFKNALQTAEKYKDSATIYLLATNISDLYIRLNRPADARSVLENVSKNYAQPMGDIQIRARTAAAYLMVYILLKQYQLANPYCDQLISIANNDKISPIDLNDIYVKIIRYYLYTNQYSSALIYLNKNSALTYKSGDPVRMANNHYWWFSLDTARHQFDAAISHLLIYHKIRDSMYNATKSRQALQFQVQFETGKKESQIRSLNERSKLEQANLKQANMVKNVTIGGILLALVIAGLFYRLYRQKRKANLAITQKNVLLEQFLIEKEWLLREVHHRIKNNLHTVICLLESQAHYLENDALKAIESSQHRMYAMSLIHQKIYQSDDIEAIDMETYLPEFVEYLRDSFGRPGHIRFQLATDPLRLGLSQAIPVALIINEAVTNAIKYAFPEGRQGMISIELHETGERVELSVTDNGVGIDPSLEAAELNSLGIKLMKGLSREIKGEISFRTDKGTQIIVIFDMNPLNKSRAQVIRSREKEVFI